ncbi:Isochorismatase family protein YecD [Andreprevotia sp. IGB-42]|uniref:hydrolase n=1 Tax=Andreprevotia sp. IGB-42 TaxID=2497473 RepID=UPI0013572926|nr:hydrolase [Andreprevotia sp. IGB-42]KAF0811707.1 Isochorismatase family protein YecD [Andreprevotia sp. IGB-42]
MLELDLKTTALVLIDLQKGILPVAQVHPASQLLQHAAALSVRFRAAGAPVVRVRVGWSADAGDVLGQAVDQPPAMPPGGLPANWLDFPDDLPTAPTDILITKRQWNAFFGTELDLQLRRRGIATLVLAGIATHVGVEGTARAGWELGYALVFAEDAISAQHEVQHRFSFEHILPRLGRVHDTATILAALTAGAG